MIDCIICGMPEDAPHHITVEECNKLDAAGRKCGAPQEHHSFATEPPIEPQWEEMVFPSNDPAVTEYAEEI